MRNYLLPTLILGLSFSAASSANELFQWHDESITYLYGGDFKVDPSKQQTLTLEHASGGNYGDLFAFIDITKYNTSETNSAGDGHTYYGEISPRL
ncbi:MAG TPA: hypothetical protein EYH51_03795, partial [Pseudomonas pachastrellae]|nr:hypothetical protein [Halopseudomonas pachastrellae]